ncbi:MAG: type II toxin-antitoxin system mRNA interferase toxin, RelE/StbE family [Methylococcaceae bacterium]
MPISLRTPDYTGSFKRDDKREHRATLDADLHAVFSALLVDQPLEPGHRNYDLTGDWNDHRDGHVKRDPVLIYENPNADFPKAGSPRLSYRTRSLIFIGSWLTLPLYGRALSRSCA